MDALYLGIDFGTSGCRASIINDNRDVVAEHVITIKSKPSQTTGHHEQDPLLWWAALQDLLQRVIKNCAAKQIKSICIDGTSSTLLLCDQFGTPTSPALMYNDNQSFQQATYIEQHAPNDSPALGANSSLAKLLYLTQHFPLSRHALHQADWLAGKLTGLFGQSDANNSLKLGYDPQHQCWPEWFNLLDLETNLLPVVHEPGYAVSTIHPNIADQFSLSATTQVIAGTTDSTAAFLASGANQPGDAMTCLGSTLVTKVISPTPIFSSKHGVYSHKILGHWLVGGASNSGGKSLLNFFSEDEMQQLSSLIKPKQPTGLDYYPLPDVGERFPIADPGYQPRLPESLSDITKDRAFIFQGLLEGIANIEKQAYDLLHQLGAPYPEQVFTTGGGSKNHAWNAIREKILGIPVSQATHFQASYGAALLARHGHIKHQI